MKVEELDQLSSSLFLSGQWLTPDISGKKGEGKGKKGTGCSQITFSRTLQ